MRVSSRVILLCVSVFFVSALVLPHTGILGFGRDLFIDEALLIDAGASFWKRGWVTFRASSLEFDPGISTGVAGVLMPSAAVLATGSYVAGRWISALQNAGAFAVVAFWLATWSGSALAGVWFLALAGLIPTMVASLVFSQGEFLSFAAYCCVVGLWAQGRHPRVAGLAAFLSVHLKLLGLLQLVGALAVGLYRRRPGLLKAGVGAVLPALSWQSWCWLRSSSNSSYLEQWAHFLSFLKRSGSGLSEAGQTSRWDLLWSTQSEFGAMRPSTQAVILVLAFSPFLLLAVKRIRERLPSPLYLILGGSSLHLVWWFLRSDAAWIRYSYMGLLGTCAVLAVILTGLMQGTSPRVRTVVPAVMLLAVVILKSSTGFREFVGKTPECGEQLRAAYPVRPGQTYPPFCTSLEGAALRYHDWIR